MDTFLLGRLRNTPLPRSHGLLPLFEAVVNSIHSIAAANEEAVKQGKEIREGRITIKIRRTPQVQLALDDGSNKRGAPPLNSIESFEVIDNGIGFTDDNLNSFRRLDSDWKAKQGCRGVGRLLWLKAFTSAYIQSTYIDISKQKMRRVFEFLAEKGIANLNESAAASQAEIETSVTLQGFYKSYREKVPKSARAIANGLLEHCLWYYVREGSSPKIKIIDEEENIDLDDLYDEYMYSSATKETLFLNDNSFDLTHIKLKIGAAKQPFIAWCAASRLVEEEPLVGKIAGLHGRLREEGGDFIYACYVTSPFLDAHVRPERFGFDIEDDPEDLFADQNINLTQMKSAVKNASERYLATFLEENKMAGKERVESFVAKRAPRYRPMLSRLGHEVFSVDPEISDKDLDVFLHKQLSDLEGSMLSEGHAIVNAIASESPEQYRARLDGYLEKVDTIKQSDLASYVFHRKVVLDIFEQAIQRDESGKYRREDLIHELIVPMRKTSNEIRLESCNLWLIDERLAFHDFLASDKPLSSYPITTSNEKKEPDICALNVFDEPILVNDGQRLPLASIVVVEIKRPMRNDARAGEDKDPIEQALGYLERIRDGGAKTSGGRQIPGSENIPGFCYAICDITPSVERRCKLLNLSVTSDHLGYFGYNPNYKSYIEVVSFDRLLNSAKERNRAFFDKLGLPNT